MGRYAATAYQRLPMSEQAALTPVDLWQSMFNRQMGVCFDNYYRHNTRQKTKKRMGCMVRRRFDNHLGSYVQPPLRLNWTMARQARNGFDNLFLHELHNAISNHVQTNHTPNMYKLLTPTVTLRQPRRCAVPSRARDGSTKPCRTCQRPLYRGYLDIDTSCMVESPPKPKTRDAHMHACNTTHD
jgi:hypothetical protein